MKKNLFIFFILLIFPIFTCLPVGMIFAVNGVDINTASLEELDKITEIGPATAQKIINARPFLSLDGLLEVNGIGEKTLQKIKEQSLACVSCQQVATEFATEQAPEIFQELKIYPAGILINEILPSPQGTDEENEWFELYNSNNFEVDLSDWKISDTTGTTTNYVFPKNIKISANGFLVFKRPNTKIILNNDEDGLVITTPDEQIVDSVIYIKAPQNQSYNKTASAWAWSTGLTPGNKNNLTSIVKSLSKSKNSVKNNSVKLELADISLPAQAGQALNINQEVKKTENPWFLFLIAACVTIISAIFVLFIKIKLNKKYVRT
jgi:competence protein ComEA